MTERVKERGQVNQARGQESEPNQGLSQRLHRRVQRTGSAIQAHPWRFAVVSGCVCLFAAIVWWSNAVGTECVKWLAAPGSVGFGLGLSGLSDHTICIHDNQ